MTIVWKCEVGVLLLSVIVRTGMMHGNYHRKIINLSLLLYFLECKNQMIVQKFSVAFSLMLGTNVKFSIDVDHNISTYVHIYCQQLQTWQWCKNLQVMSHKCNVCRIYLCSMHLSRIKCSCDTKLVCFGFSVFYDFKHSCLFIL